MTAKANNNNNFRFITTGLSHDSPENSLSYASVLPVIACVVWQGRLHATINPWQALENRNLKSNLRRIRSWTLFGTNSKSCLLRNVRDVSWLVGRLSSKLAPSLY